jgi:hypothetical protein
MQFVATLPDRVQRLLESCPASGSGQRAVHRWILQIANELRHFLFAADAADLIGQYISRQPKPGEIIEAVKLSYGAPATAGVKSGITWPKPSVTQIDGFACEYDSGKPALEILRARSKPIPAETHDVFAQLYLADTLLGIGHSVRHCVVVRVGKMKRYEVFPLVVPNPLNSIDYHDPDTGKLKERSLGNIKERRFIVIDLDIKPPWAQAVLDHWQACGYSPLDGQALVLEGIRDFTLKPPALGLVVYSGNQSLQAWFCTLAATGDLAAWFSDCCLLGADPAGWSTAQWFRMPNARRPETGKQQEIIYFDSAAMIQIPKKTNE